MRMKEKGVSTAVLVAVPIIIVVAIVVPVVTIVLLKGGDGGVLATVPVYPGAQLMENVNVEQELASAGITLPAGWSGKSYTTTASPETVASWYRIQMAGWTKVIDNTTESQGTTVYALRWEKGNDAAVINVFSYPGYGNILLIVAGPTQTQTPGGGTSGSIVGTWQGTHLGSTETFTFNSNGTYSWSSGADQANGTWSMSGDILTLDTTEWKVVFGTDSMQWYEKYEGSWMSTPSRSFTRVT